MGSAAPRTPRYCRQKEKGRPDRAYCKIDGKRILLGTYGSPESYKKYAELLNGERKKAPATPAPVERTISMLMVEYLTYAMQKHGGERASEVLHFKYAFRILRRTHGDLLAKDFGPKAYKAARLAMIEAGWSRRYISDQCGRIKRLIGWGVSEEILPRDARHALDSVSPLAFGEFGVRETSEVPPVADEVVEATLLHLGPTVCDMVRIQRLTGMRPGELVQLAAAHIDRSDEIWMFKPPRHKTQRKGKKRAIAIGPRAQAILAKYLFGARCFQYTTASYRRAIYRACLRGDIPVWKPNQLRHTAATAIREEFGLEHAQVALGHSRASTTEIYAVANQEKAIEVAKKIG